MKTPKIAICGLALSLAATLAVGSFAVAANKKEAAKKDPRQLVYELYAFNGKGYAQSFVPLKEDSFYVISGANSIVTPKVAQVDWSGDNGEYTADWENWEHPAQEVGVKMQILKDGKVIKTVNKEDVSMYYPDANNQELSTLLSGNKAKAEYASYNKAIDAYWDASSKYGEIQQKYEETVAKLKETPGAVLPKAPVQPQQPKYYVSQPMKAFIVNLKPGNYTIKTLDAKNRILKGSEKTLVSFKSRRDGIGYNIIPESKWTFPVQSDDPTSIIYYVGERSLYFNPQQETEFNLHNYSKLMKPNSPFSNNAPKDQWSWIYVSPQNKASLKLYKNGKMIDTIVEKPYVVEQTPGAALGYNILDWNPKKSKSQEPTFRAHKIVLKDKGTFTLKYVGKDGKEDSAGYREMRPVEEVNPNILFAISFIPVLGGIILSIIRAIRTRSAIKHSASGSMNA